MCYTELKEGFGMFIQTGYIYHIKDDFFNKVNDSGLMTNHENGHTRPTYLTIKDGDILWFIPLSSKIAKYQALINQKIKKYGDCKSIMIREIAGKKTAILLQNAFPTLEKYIDHPHTINGNPIKVINSLEQEILNNFKYLISLKNSGINLFFANIDNIKKIMLNELTSP